MRTEDLCLPRRLLVSPDGIAHDPTCRRVPATAEMNGWGELTQVAQALQDIDAGQSVDSSRRGVLPGPQACALCPSCTTTLTELAIAR